MEIPKSLQEEIQSVQNKLKNAIQNHQVYVGKLNDDPNNQELLGQLHEIQEHIISLSKCQKQVVQRLRKEVKLYEAANSNGTKVSIASLLGLNNNNNITNNNETKTSDSKQTLNGKNLNGLSRRSSKDDYEDGIQNLDLPSPVDDCQNNCAKARPRLEETVSNDEDVIEIAVADNSIGKRNRDEICEIQLYDQLDFLGCLGLITSDKHTELQNKRAERKRRSTANPQFVYSNWEIPTKRKRHSYLQSNGTAPQTRQTTARLNGPSPPPHKVAGIKPSPPPPKASVKSLIPTQKSTTRPNILRNNPESKVFTGKIKSENGLSQVQTPLSSKSVQSVGSKAVHIPGLPSSLTIERIENDACAVCIHCRNPGSLTICEICSANFHVSCHVVASAPPRTCPKCLTKLRVQDGSDSLEVECKEEDEIEEKERDRYDLRERNSDLRLQVYELEKRSQLLGQSLQQQHRTRQELLGKQEKTQRSIKRLVDFIKVMQQKNDPFQPSASTSFHPQPSSSPLPQTPSPRLPPLPSLSPQSASANPKVSSQLQPQLMENQKSPRFSSTNSHSLRVSSPTQRSLTPTNCQSPVFSKKNHIHISSSKKSPTHQETQEETGLYLLQSSPEISRKNETPLRSSTINNLHLPATMTTINPKSNRSLPVRSTTIHSPPANSFLENSSTTDKGLTERRIRRQNRSLAANQILQRKVSTEINASESCILNSVSASSDPLDSQTPLYPSTVLSTTQKPSVSLISQNNQKIQEKLVSSCPLSQVVKGNQKPIYSTHCSQAITSPIPSPVVLSNRKTQVQNKTNQNQNVTNTHLKNSNRNTTRSTDQDLDFSLTPPQTSPNT